MLQLNTVGLYPVMRDFYTLTAQRIVIFDTDFREVLAYPQERDPFCRRLRSDGAGETACRASDREGCLRCARKKELTVYRCHAGLTEAVVPITDQNGVLAYVMFGQVVPAETGESTKASLKRRYPSLTEEIDGLAVKTATELNAVATVLQAITAYVMTNRWVASGKSEFIRELDRYLEEHLSRGITVDEICAAFRIGRTRFYELAETYLGCSPAAYVRQKRIDRACELLRETHRPITDVASAVGFSDYNHFSRVFRQVTGLSARRWRKENAGESGSF